MLTMVWDHDVRKPGESKKNIVVHNKEALAYVRGHGVNNARRHGERNNSKDNGEGLAGPTDGLIQRPLLNQEARIIGHL